MTENPPARRQLGSEADCGGVKLTAHFFLLYVDLLFILLTRAKKHGDVSLVSSHLWMFDVGKFGRCQMLGGGSDASSVQMIQMLLWQNDTLSYC